MSDKGWLFASAYTVFFIVSVGSTSALSPATCAAVNSPSKRTDTVRSEMSWLSPRRWILTSRIPDLP